MTGDQHSDRQVRNGAGVSARPSAQGNDAFSVYEAVAGHPTYLGTLDHLISMATLVDAHSLLDVGSGTGGLLERLLLKAPAGAYWGAEPDDEMRDVLTNRLGDQVGVLSHRCDEIDEAFPPDFLDAVAAANSVHMFEDPMRFFSAAWRILRPGGTLAFSSAFFSGAARREDLPVYLELLSRARAEVNRNAGAVQRSNASRSGTPEQWATSVEQAGFAVRHLELLPVALDAAVLTEIVSAPVFAHSVMPSVTPVESSRAMARAAKTMCLRDPGMSIERTWMYISATKTDE